MHLVHSCEAFCAWYEGGGKGFYKDGKVVTVYKMLFAFMSKNGTIDVVF